MANVTTDPGHGQDEPVRSGHVQNEQAQKDHHDGAGVIKVALPVAGGSAAGIGGIVIAAGQAAIDATTARFAVAVFALIMLGALAVAAVYALRRR